MANESAGKGYKSKLKLPIPQTPSATQSPELFADLVETYNSIHMLNAQADQVNDQIFNLNKEAPLDTQMPFPYTLWMKAAHSLEVGKIVTYNSGGVTVGWKTRYSVPVGMVLTEAEEAGDLVKVGFGPAVVKFDGIEYGQVAYVIIDRREAEYPRTAYGSLTLDSDPDGYRVEAVGICGVDGYVFLFTDPRYKMTASYIPEPPPPTPPVIEPDNSP